MVGQGVFCGDFKKSWDNPYFIPSYHIMVRYIVMKYIYGKGSENPSGYEYPLYI